MRKISTILIAFLILSKSMYSQIIKELVPSIYLSTAITIGYTFRCGWNYGFDLTLGVFQIENTYPPTHFAINSQFFITNYQTEFHKFSVFNFVVDNPITQFGLGIGAVSKKWGYKNVNKDMALGYSVVFNIGANNYKYPWFGIKVFVPSENWSWSSLPYYFSYYFYWRQEPIIFHKP